MIRILFVAAVDPFSVEENLMQPLWPAYLAAYAEGQFGKGALEFKYTNQKIRQEIEAFKPDIVAISSVTKNYGYAMEHAKTAKRYGLPVIIGGMHITMLPQCLSPDMDAGCIGEGERTFCEMLRLYGATGTLGREGLGNIHGIVYHDGGTLRETPKRRPISSLDDLPHPMRSLTGYRNRAYLYTARGCAYNCIFCSCTRHWGAVRYCSPEYVIAEIRELIDHGVKVIRFNDDNFIANKQRFLKIAELIRANGFHKRVKFSCWCRSNNVTPEVVEALRSMNVVSVKMGLESGSDRVLDYLKGSVTVKDNWTAVDLLKDAGIQVNGDFIIGAPDETYEEMMLTYEFIRNSRVDFVDIAVLTPLPGTPIWEYAIKNKIVTDNMNWTDIDFRFSNKNDGFPILSRTVTRTQMVGIFDQFKRLRFIKSLKAIPNSPWLNEIPRLSRQWFIGKMAKIAAVPLRFFSGRAC